MRTIEELLKEKVDRTAMTEAEESLWNEYWFEKYEEEGFSKVFCSPYEAGEFRNGQPFKVLGRVMEGFDKSSLPAWEIEFDDGARSYAYPEEIIPSEIRANSWRESDKKYLDQLEKMEVFK